MSKSENAKADIGRLKSMGLSNWFIDLLLKTGESSETIITSNTLRLTPVAFAELPNPATTGMVACIYDCNTNAWGVTAEGGSDNTVIVWFTGDQWHVMGK